jgi:hypothetical protein
VDRSDQLVEVIDALLEEVGTALGAMLQERERVLGIRELAEYDYAGLGARLAKSLGRPNALVTAARGHPDVGEDNVGSLGLRGYKQRVEIVASRNYLEITPRLEEPTDALPNKVVVLRQHDPDGNGAHVPASTFLAQDVGVGAA